MIYTRLKDLAYYLCDRYDEWDFRLMLLKYTALSTNRKTLDETIKAYNDILGKMNALDTMNIYNITYAEPIVFKRRIIRLSILELLGYYFSDEDYEKIIKEVLEEIRLWINDENPNIFLNDCILKMLYSNHLRIDNNIIIDICITTLEKGYSRFWDNVFDVINVMGVNNISPDRKELLINEFISIINSDKKDILHSKFERAIIRIRKETDEYAEMIDKNIKEKMSNFYNERYIFEVFLNETGKATLSIEKNIVDISKRNNEQGVSGHYYGYATNPYSIIKYTLIENKEILNQKYVKDILYVIKETLFSETQTLNEKISAFKLLTFLRITYENYEVLFDEFNEEIIGKEDITLRGKEILIEKSSHLIMNLIYFLYILSCGIEQNSKVVSICSSFAESKDFERLEAAYILHEYFGLKDTNTISYNDLYPILSMLLYFCHDIQHSVRYYAIYALINMLSQRTFSPIVYQLSNSMDFESLAIKKLILQHKDDISKFDKTISEGILQKAKADTNYIIKMVVQNL